MPPRSPGDRTRAAGPRISAVSRSCTERGGGCPSLGGSARVGVNRSFPAAETTGGAGSSWSARIGGSGGDRREVPTRDESFGQRNGFPTRAAPIAIRDYAPGIVKLTKSSSIDPQDTGLQPVVNPPCWASKTAVSFNLTIPCSSARSAYIRFSVACSASSSRNRFTSNGKPPQPEDPDPLSQSRVERGPGRRQSSPDRGPRAAPVPHWYHAWPHPRERHDTGWRSDTDVSFDGVEHPTPSGHCGFRAPSTSGGCWSRRPAAPTSS